MPEPVRQRTDGTLASLSVRLGENLREGVEALPPFYLATTAMCGVLAMASLWRANSRQVSGVTVAAAILLVVARMVMAGTVTSAARQALRWSCGFAMVMLVANPSVWTGAAADESLLIGVFSVIPFLLAVSIDLGDVKPSQWGLASAALIAGALLWQQGVLFVGVGSGEALAVCLFEFACIVIAVMVAAGATTGKARRALVGVALVAVAMLWLACSAYDAQAASLKLLQSVAVCALFVLTGVIARAAATKLASRYLAGICSYAGVYLVAGSCLGLLQGPLVVLLALLPLVGSFPVVVAILSATRLRADVGALREPTFHFEWVVGVYCLAAGAGSLAASLIRSSDWTLLSVVQLAAGGVIVARDRWAYHALLAVAVASILSGQTSDVLVAFALVAAVANLYRTADLERASHYGLRLAARWGHEPEVRERAVGCMGKLLSAAEQRQDPFDREERLSLLLLEQIAFGSNTASLRASALAALPDGLAKARLGDAAKVAEIALPELSSADLALLKQLLPDFQTLFGAGRAVAGVERLRQIDDAGLLGIIFRLAAYNGWLEHLTAVVDKVPSLLRTRMSGQTVASVLVQRGYPEVLRHVAKLCPECLTDPNDAPPRTAVHAAAATFSIECLKVIAEVSPAALVLAGPKGKTPAHVCAKNGNAECLALFLETAPHCIDLVDANGHSVGQLIARRRNREHLNLLRRATAVDDQALFDACKAGDLLAVKTLLGHGADPNATHRQNREVPFPIMWAAREGSAEVVGLLIRHGAEVNARDSLPMRKFDVLRYAVAARHPETMRLLVEAGAKLDAVDDDQMTSLMFAAREGSVVAVNSLLELGATRTLQNDKLGVTALDLAEKNGHGEIAALLSPPQVRAKPPPQGLPEEAMLSLAGDIRRELFGASEFRLRVKSASPSNGQCSVSCDVLGGSQPRPGDTFRIKRTSRSGTVKQAVSMGDVLSEILRGGGSVSVLGDGRSMRTDVTLLVAGLSPDDFRPGDELVSS